MANKGQPFWLVEVVIPEVAPKYHAASRVVRVQAVSANHAEILVSHDLGAYERVLTVAREEIRHN